MFPQVAGLTLRWPDAEVSNQLTMVAVSINED